MDSLAPFFAYSIALGIAAVIPGPGIAALVGQSLGGSLRGALYFMAGIALGDLAYLTVAIVGLAAIAQSFAAAFAAIKIAGALYLLYLAWKFWTAKAGLTEIDPHSNESAPRAFWAGLAVTLGNPKTVVFYLAIVPTVMDLESVGLGAWAGLSLLTVLILFVILTPYAALAARARRLMANSAALTRLNRTAASLIGAAGLVMLAEAAQATLRRS